MIAEALDQTFGLRIKRFAKPHFLEESLLKYFIGVSAHERRSTIRKFINHDAKCIPVCRLRVPSVVNDFGSNILRCPTESISPLTLLQPFDESKISQLKEPVLRDKHILWLQVSIYQISTVQVFKAENHLGSIKCY